MVPRLESAPRVNFVTSPAILYLRYAIKLLSHASASVTARSTDMLGVFEGLLNYDMLSEITHTTRKSG